MDQIKFNSLVMNYLDQNENWTKEADVYGKEDDVVRQSEFRKYMLEHFDGWDGTETVKKQKDLINKFWTSINVSQKLDGGKKSKLSEDEIERIGQLKAATSTVQSVVSTYMSSASLNRLAAGGCDINTLNLQNNIVEALNSKAQDFVKAAYNVEHCSEKNGSFDKYLNKLNALLNEAGITNIAKGSVPTEEGWASKYLQNYLNGIIPKEANKQVALISASTMLQNHPAGCWDLKGIEDRCNGYNPNEDKQLQGYINKIISDYATKPNENGTYKTGAEVATAIEKLIYTYAKSAGYTSDSSDTAAALNNLKNNYGIDLTQSLNNWQKAALEQKLKTTIEDELKGTYNDYKDIYDSAINDYVKNKVATMTPADFNFGAHINHTGTDTSQFTGTYASFDAYKDFEASDAGKKAIYTVNIYTTLNSLNFTAAGLTADLQDKLTGENAKWYQKKLDPIIEEVVAKLMDDKDLNLEAELVKAIKAHLADFYTGGLSDMKVDEMLSVYQNLYTAAEETSKTDVDAALQAHKDAAIKLLDGIISKGDQYKETVESVLGSDWKAEINGCETPSKILEKLGLTNNNGTLTKVSGGLMASTAALIDAKYLTVATFAIGDGTKNDDGTWKDQDSISLPAGISKTLTMNTVFNNGNDQIESSSMKNVRYEATNKPAGLEVTITDNKITLKSSTEIKSGKLTLAVIVDGHKVDQRVIDVSAEAFDKSKLIEKGGSMQHVDSNCVVLGGGVANGTKITYCNLKDLYNNNAVINLFQDWDETYLENKNKKKITDRLSSLINGIKAVLTGLDNDILTKACDNVYAKLVSDAYINDSGYSDAVNDTCGVWDTHQGYEGDDQTTMIAHLMRTGIYAKDGSVNNSYKDKILVTSLDEKGLNDWSICVNFKNLVDYILAEYQNLLGA